MDLKPHVRGELLLSKDLLGRSEYRSSDDERVAHDIIIADDAAEIALGAICCQLGCTASRRRPSISDYFDWLVRTGKTQVPVPGMEYFTELHKARIDLQTRFLVPDLFKWHRVKETTLGFITRWCQEYLHLQVWNLQWNLAAVPIHRNHDASQHQDVTQQADEAHPAEAEAVFSAGNRRESPRYECEGNAEIHIASSGRIVRGRIVNLSLGGCYIETSASIDLGSRVEILLRITGLAFRAMGEVRSCYGSAGIGVKFMSMSNRGRARLQELIAELEEAWFAAGMPHEEESI